MSVTLASGEPSTRPSCGIPLRSTTGVSVAGALESPRPMSATATSARAAAIATAKATTTVRPEGRLLELGFIAAMRREVCPSFGFGVR
jgi:heterodisulfide reductase subunit A-like polyferredoxin